MSNYNESMEMYLETIYILETNHGHAHVVDIAKSLGVTKPSVTKAMNQLKKQGIIRKEAYGSITLTEKGRKISKEIYMNHHMIARFLEKSLGLTAFEASENACRMEHYISGAMLAAIKTYLEDEANK